MYIELAQTATLSRLLSPFLSHTHTYTHIHTLSHIHTHTQTPWHSDTHLTTYSPTHTHTPTYAHPPTHTHSRTHKHTPPHTHILRSDLPVAVQTRRRECNSFAACHTAVLCTDVPHTVSEWPSRDTVIPSHYSVLATTWERVCGCVCVCVYVCAYERVCVQCVCDLCECVCVSMCVPHTLLK